MSELNFSLEARQRRLWQCVSWLLGRKDKAENVPNADSELCERHESVIVTETNELISEQDNQTAEAEPKQIQTEDQA